MQTEPRSVFADFATCTCLAHRVTTFLAWESQLLDDWRLEEWLALCDEDIAYVIPATDCPEGTPQDSVVFINDDRGTLTGRVRRLQSRHAYREYPSSRTRRFLSNILVREGRDGLVEATAGLQVYRFRTRRTAVYVGRYDVTLVPTDDGFRFRRRCVTLDNETLDEHGAISIIL